MPNVYMTADMSKLLSRLSRQTYQQPEYNYDDLPGKVPRSKSFIPLAKEEGLKDIGVKRENEWGWNPLVLTKIALLSFIAIFLACLTALLLLWHFSNENGGLDLLISNQYTWKYGPTAILILLISIWRQLDYQIKVLIPWKELRKGSAPANKSILLDYTSPFQVVAFVRATWNGHVAVILTILGFVTLKVITVASTGLLFATTIKTIPQSVELAGVTKLNASQYDASAVHAMKDTSLVYTAFALMQKGLAFAEGTKPDMVYDTFSLPNVTEYPNVTFSANVQGFFPKYNCSPISIIPVMQPADSDPGKLFWNTTACNKDSFWVFRSLKPETQFCPPRKLMPARKHIECAYASEDADIETRQTTAYQTILTMADFRFTQVFDASIVTSNLTYGDVVETESWNIEIKELSSVICSPYYTIQTVRVTYDMSQTPPVISIAQPVPGSETHFETFSNQNLLAEFEDSLFHREAMFGNFGDLTYALEDPDTMSKMMAGAIGGSYQDLLDEKVLADAAEVVFEHIAVQIAKKFLTQPGQSIYQGGAVFVEERLQVRTLSLAIMTTGFGLMAVMVVGVLSTRPFGVGRRNPESIASIAGAIAHGEGFQKCLQICARSTEDHAARFLKQGQYSSSVHSDLESSHIEIHHQHNAPEIRLGNVAARVAWWDPLTLRKAFVLLTFLTPLLVIAALEVLQQISDRNNGFSSMQDVSSTVAGIYTRFVPALIMLLVATSFNCLDFNVSCLAPFTCLRSSKDRGNEVLSKPLLGQYPPLALWMALRLHYWTAALTAVAAFMGSVLTIIVSSLLTVENVPYESAVSLKQLDTWNTTWRGSSLDDHGAAVLSSLIERAILSYPAYTYDELALPALGQADIMSDGDKQPPGLVSVQVPALRGKLECISLAREHYNFTAKWEFSLWTIGVDAAAPLPSHCPFGGPYANETKLKFHTGFTGTPTYFGRIIDLHVGPYDEITGASFGDSNGWQPDNQPGCPSLAFWFGYVDGENMDNSRDTVLVCDQQLERVTANMTFTYPEYSIPPDHPPIPDESTATLLPSGPNNETAFWWRIQTHMERRFLLHQQPFMSFPESIPSHVMPFFQGVLEGKTPMPLDTLLDSATAFIGIQRFYRRYMAQAISSNMRRNITAASTSRLEVRQTTDDLPAFTATYVPTVGTPRLVQHKKPKLALQIMLAVMFTCGTLGWLLGDFHKVVPWNPCTIAGIAVLFAGSRMCDPRLQIWRKSRQFRDQQNMDSNAALTHGGHDDESSANTGSDEVIPSSSNDGHRNNNDGIELSSISTSVRPRSSVSNQLESEVHIVYTVDPTSEEGNLLSSRDSHRNNDVTELFFIPSSVPSHDSVSNQQEPEVLTGSNVGQMSEEVDLTSSGEGYRNDDVVELSSISTSVRPRSSIFNQPNSEVHFVSGRESVLSRSRNHNHSGTGITEDQWPGLRFMLGWWKDGSFMGRNGPPINSGRGSANVKTASREDYREAGVESDDEIERGGESARWRYGIDVVS